MQEERMRFFLKKEDKWTVIGNCGCTNLYTIIQNIRKRYRTESFFNFITSSFASLNEYVRIAQQPNCNKSVGGAIKAKQTTKLFIISSVALQYKLTL